MDLIQMLLQTIGEQGLAELRSQLVSVGDQPIRRCRQAVPIRVPIVDACGAKLVLTGRLEIDVAASHDELAALSSTTRAQIDALTDVEVERDAPFVQPMLAKVQAVLESPADYQAQWPASNWTVPVARPFKR